MTTRPSSRTLVGREPELERLREALKHARAGEPATVLVGGEAGVGKTRLVGELLGHARAEGTRVLSGQCLELGEEGPPFAPFAAALRDLLRAAGPAAFAGHEQEFARLLPELGPVGPEPVVDAQRGSLFELVAGLLSRLAGERPLVFVIEDLHWADRSTRDLIAFLVRSARIARALLVCTYRSDELHRGHPLRPFLAELDRVRDVDRLELGRLDRDGTAAILAQLYGAEQSPRDVDSIHDRAQGNPFFTEELAACGDPQHCIDIPDTLRDLLLTRVDSLPETSQRVLRIAAAGGTRIGHELLAEVAELPQAELEAALRVAVAAQLLVAEPDGGYEFRHALVREAVHDDLLPSEYARLHARYAATIEARPHLVPAGDAPAELAHHWYAANDLPRALTATLRAAVAAGERYAYAEKSRLLKRVLKLWEQVPDAAERLGMSHLSVLEETLTATVTAGDYMHALTLVRVALDEVDRDAEPLRAALLLHQRAGLQRQLGKNDGSADWREAVLLAHRAPEEPRQIMLLADLASQLTWFDLAEAARIAREVAAAAERQQNMSVRVSATLTMGRIRRREESVEASLPLLREAAELARSTGDGPQFVKAMVNLSDSLFEIGDYAGSEQAAADGAAHAEQFGISRSTGAFLFSNRAEALAALGRWDEADALCAQTARIDPPGALGLHWLQIRARLRLARGDSSARDLVDRALRFSTRAYVEPQQRLPSHHLGIEAALAAGDLAEAARVARAGLTDPALADQPRYAWPLLAEAARVAVAGPGAGLSPDDVAAVAETIEIRYPAERAFAADMWAALAGGSRAIDSMNAPGEALPAARAAVAAWRVDGQPYPLTRALLALAGAAAAAGDRPLAEEALEEAGELATRLHARPLLEEIATLGRRAGVRARGAPAPAGPHVLTEREREVLRLVAEGYSNGRIAEQLYISPKTASVHVSRIIAKLDVANRIEAAAAARRLGLLQP
ncbi:helix-turn-helix transcriptional regulator [Dactylosporangium sp. CA-139066]|uniref:helix-turn-helix transcriptional regulator n=1 Tax=Dactylosporangium sp. CA-139066 TaxID=3239930 RepID=UPI003D8D3ED7